MILEQVQKYLFRFPPISIVVIIGPHKYGDIILSKRSPLESLDFKRSKEQSLTTKTFV
jgi:hypothetical protein